jgi:ElaA protein
MNSPTFKWARIDNLSAREMHAIVAQREQVFVVEQHCPFQDADALDLVCWHLIGTQDGEFATYARLVDPGKKFDEPSIGRVITTQNHRGKGLGRLLMQEALRGAQTRWPGLGIRISAQAYLLAFYSGFGFEPVGDQYLEDAILHVDMLRKPVTPLPGLPS